MWRLQNPPKPTRAFSWWHTAHWSRRALLLPMVSTSIGHQQRVELEILLLQGKITSHSQHLGEPGGRIQGDRCSGHVKSSGLVSPPSRAGYVQRSLNEASKVSVQCSSLLRDCPEFASSSWQCSPEQAELSKAWRPPRAWRMSPRSPGPKLFTCDTPGRCLRTSCSAELTDGIHKGYESDNELKITKKKGCGQILSQQSLQQTSASLQGHFQAGRWCVLLCFPVCATRSLG